MAYELSFALATKLYLCQIRPALDYAAPVWHGSLTEEEALTPEQLQASVARRLLKASWDTPKAELFRRLDWPVLRWRREIASMMLSHSFLPAHPHDAQENLSRFFFSTHVHLDTCTPSSTDHLLFGTHYLTPFKA